LKVQGVAVPGDRPISLVNWIASGMISDCKTNFKKVEIKDQGAHKWPNEVRQPARWAILLFTRSMIFLPPWIDAAAALWVFAQCVRIRQKENARRRDTVPAEELGTE
jgi:hypothetical protein